MNYNKLKNVRKKMLERCYNKNHQSYSRYGGSGVTVCDRWKAPRVGLKNFIEDMGDSYQDGLTLNRVNGGKVYSKESCEWVTTSEQAYDKKVPVTNTSGVVGVTRSRNKWRAEIWHNYKRVHLGYFTTFEEAVEARKQGELDYYGFLKQKKYL